MRTVEVRRFIIVLGKEDEENYVSLLIKTLHFFSISIKRTSFFSLSM
jgi:hypothetical protein